MDMLKIDSDVKPPTLHTTKLLMFELDSRITTFRPNVGLGGVGKDEAERSYRRWRVNEGNPDQMIMDGITK